MTQPPRILRFAAQLRSLLATCSLPRRKPGGWSESGRWHVELHQLRCLSVIGAACARLVVADRIVLVSFRL